MNSILLYGPPAVGKLSIAKEIAARSQYKLFNNHASIDFVERIFERGHLSFSKTIMAVRLFILEEAAKSDTNLIFTLVYAHPVDTPDKECIANIIKKHGGNIPFVHLNATTDALLNRFTESSRRSKNTIQDKKTLEGLLSQYDLLSPYPARENLGFNTVELSAKEIAIAILENVEG